METKIIGKTNSPDSPAPLRVSCLGKLAYLLMMAGALVLALTGIGTFISGHAPMTGWCLMAHVAAAPAFAIGLAFVALTWSDRNRFSCARSHFSGLTKLLLWMILLCGLLVILSGVVPMTPVFGTSGQHLLYLTHRYGGITMTALLVLHLVNLVRSK
jgi:cytochrome b subunit of formate dehydrogenase